MDDPSDMSALDGVAWRADAGLTDYPAALADMEARAAAIHLGTAQERIWLLQHPPLYTAGTSADPAELIDARFPVFQTGRGGRYTYHGPGQRVGYVQLDLQKRGRDIRCYVHALEDWVIRALARLGVTAWSVDGRVGIWTDDGGSEAKVGAIGVRVKRWVTLHGFAVNIDPDLGHFGGIIPCGLPEFPVTSLARLGLADAGPAFDAALRDELPTFLCRLGRTDGLEGHRLCS